MFYNYLIYLLLSPVVCYTLENDDLWYSYQFGSGLGNRKELFINKVDAVDNFKTKENVLEWRSLSLQNRSIALGVTKNGVTVLQVDKIGESFSTSETHTPMNATVVDACIFKYWNEASIKSEIIIVVAVDTQNANNSVDLFWFRMAVNNKLISIWKWSLGKKINYLNIFQLNDNIYNILIANERYENYTTVDWYEFHLGQHKDYWLKQAIRLDSATNSSTISTFGAKVFLSIPQTSILRIFDLKDNSHFDHYANISVGLVTFVTSFKVGFHSYLAIDGQSAGIYKFTKRGPSHPLEKQNIENFYVNGIDYWLPMPMSTYRDEIVLIAERSLDFISHRSHAIQVVVHHAGKFVLHEEMTCDYYGEISNGLNCLVEEDDTLGIQGSAFLTVNNTLGVLVPRHQKSSGLFAIHTEMRELPSPLEERMRLLDEKRKRLEEKIRGNQGTEPSSQDSKISEVNVDPIVGEHRQSEAMVDFNLENITARISKLQETINAMLIDVQKLPSLRPDRKEYGTLVFNGLVEIQGRSDIQNVLADSFNGATIEKIKSDIFNGNNPDNVAINAHKTFTNLRTDEMEFNSINGIPAESLIFKSDRLILEGNITIEGELIVDGNAEAAKVNNLNLQEEIVYIPSGKKFNGTLDFDNLLIRETLNTLKANKFPVHGNYQDSFVDAAEPLEKIEFDSIFLPGNLSVLAINEENFNQTLSALCFKNLLTYIPNSTFINGDVFVKNGAMTLHLNRLKFPQEYLLSKSSSFSLITGAKTFSNNLIIDDLTTRNVNGVDPNDVVTLTADQSIDGKMSFAHLEITNNLKYDGELIGTQPETLLTKPTLLDSHNLSSNINFQDLEVTGIITIGQTFNNITLKEVLSDIVYKSDVSANITGVKKFPLGLTVLQDAYVASNAISNVDISNLIRKDTSEILRFNELHGDVTFENVLISGTYGNVDVVRLDQETVKLSGEQFISSEIVFEEELNAENIDIKQSLNEVSLEKYLYANGDINLDVLNVPELIVQNLSVEHINAVTENFGIAEFNNRRFSLSSNQNINSEFRINASRIPHLSTNIINGYIFQDIFDIDVYASKIIDMLMSGKLTIKELLVDDTINIKQLNGKLMNDILKLCLSNKGGERDLEINFQDVRFGDLEVENFNDINFEDFKQNLVFKDDPNVGIEGIKAYFNGFEVKNYIQTSALNQIPVYDILRKNGQQEITSAIVILGEVSVDGDSYLGETINQVPISNITNTFKVVNSDTYKVKDSVVFDKEPIIEHLVLKNLNGVDMEDHLSNLVYLDRPNDQHVGNITFGNSVHLTGNLDIGEHINHIDLARVKDEVVLITQDGNVQGAVVFSSDVYAKEQVEIETDLYTSNILGVNPADWNTSAVFINQGKIPTNLKFQNGVIESKIQAKFINDINLETLIHLKNDQVIKQKLYFDELGSIKDIKVHEFVNGLKLEPEYLNTVRSGQIQEVSGNVVFQGNVLVRDFLDVHGLVNEHNLGHIVTTDSNQNLSGIYHFDKISVNNDMIVGLVNSINMIKWMHNGVKRNSKSLQTVSNAWTVGSNLTFKNNVMGIGRINGLEIRKMADDVEYKRTFKYTVENDLIDNYKKICRDVNNIIATTKKQVYSFKYLDFKQFIEFPDDIQYVHQFQHESKDYLLINTKGCSTNLLVWSEEFFYHEHEYDMGEIDQIVTVTVTKEENGQKDIYLVTRSKNVNSSCEVVGTNVWKFDEGNLLLVQKLNDMTLLQKSKKPGTFYAIEAENVLEYRISNSADTLVHVVQKWTVPLDNAAFLEEGLKTGLAIRNGKQLYKLQSEALPVDMLTNEVAIGNYSVIENQFIPGIDGEMLIMSVGYPRWKRMVAVPTHEETSVKGKLDFIKIYEDALKGKVFHKVPTYKPSSLVSLEFGENGETLLIFLENHEVLQIYEYKGIEGFKYRAQANVKANHLITIKLPCGINNKPRLFIGMIAKNDFNLLEAIMDGDQLDLDQVTCRIS